MNALKPVRWILFGAFLCATAPSLAAAPDQECGKRVSLAGLIANPHAHHDKALWIVAYVTIDFEYMTACPSGNETRIKRCLWLNIDEGPYTTDQDYARYQAKLQTWRRFHRQTVAIRATFDQSVKGHFSMWPGGLRNVTEVSGHEDGWSFVSNAAVPRSACAGAPPAPKDSRKRGSGVGGLQ